MYLQSILYTINEIRDDIEKHLNTSCLIYIQTVKQPEQPAIKINVVLPEYNAVFERTYTEIEIAATRFPSATMEALKNEAREHLSEIVNKKSK